MGSDLTSTIESLAEHVVSRGLGVPAIFLLELHKPLTSILHATSVVSSPLLRPLFGVKHYDALLGLLESRESIELVIQRIENLQEEARS